MQENAKMDPTNIINRRIQLDDVIKFMDFMVVSESDKVFVDGCAGKLLPLLTNDYYIEEGIGYQELIDILTEIDFWQGLDLTDRESVSVHSA